jgi:hypothetical protein
MLLHFVQSPVLQFVSFSGISRGPHLFVLLSFRCDHYAVGIWLGLCFGSDLVGLALYRNLSDSSRGHVRVRFGSALFGRMPGMVGICFGVPFFVGGSILCPVDDGQSRASSTGPARLVTFTLS